MLLLYVWEGCSFVSSGVFWFPLVGLIKLEAPCVMLSNPQHQEMLCFVCEVEVFSLPWMSLVKELSNVIRGLISQGYETNIPFSTQQDQSKHIWTTLLCLSNHNMVHLLLTCSQTWESAVAVKRSTETKLVCPVKLPLQLQTWMNSQTWHISHTQLSYISLLVDWSENSNKPLKMWTSCVDADGCGQSPLPAGQYTQTRLEHKQVLLWGAGFHSTSLRLCGEACRTHSHPAHNPQ